MANNPGAAVNPSIQSVIAEVTDTITAACKPVPVDQDAIDDWAYTYTPPFTRRLSVAVWDTEKANVLNAAEQHGIIAKALASLSGATHVDKTLLRTASKLVEDHCKQRFGTQGIWCS